MHTAPSRIKDYSFLLPPINQQTSIATLLNSLEDKISILQNQNAILEKIAETLYRQWFVEEENDDWIEKELSEIIDVVIDNRGKTPPTVEFKTEYPLIEVNALNSNSCLIDYSVIRKYVSKETFENWFRKHLIVNDIIISTVGTIGVFSINLTNKGCIAQNLVGLRSKSISGYFIYNFLKVNKENILNLDIGGVQPSIKVPHLLDLKIKLPSDGLINKYHTTVDEYYKKIAINSNQIRTLTALRDTLLPKLMSGEVRVEN
jgi:type I restriction enzyme S subunit